MSIEAGAGARLIEHASSGSWHVEVTFTVKCIGAGTRGASYSGNLYLVDSETRKSIYLGGVASRSGRQIVSVAPTDRWQRLQPELKVSCWDDETLHGSATIETAGSSVLIPPRNGDGEGAAGGGGGSGGSGGADPTTPPRPGGCVRPIVGTDGPDTLLGGGAGDVIFGRRGNDTIRGRDGHDCLIGAAGNDVLRGENGDDRLTGGSGSDTLVGGPGVNVYDAGSGNDVVEAANGRPEIVRCGPGQDTARVDRRDSVSGCERVR